MKKALLTLVLFMSMSAGVVSAQTATPTNTATNTPTLTPTQTPTSTPTLTGPMMTATATAAVFQSTRTVILKKEQANPTAYTGPGVTKVPN